MRLRALPILALIAGGTNFSTAHAAENGLSIEEVVVTARKQEESSQDVPIAMTAISAQLTNSTIRNLTDLNGFAPNVTISEDGSRGGGGDYGSGRGRGGGSRYRGCTCAEGSGQL